MAALLDGNTKRGSWWGIHLRVLSEANMPRRYDGSSACRGQTPSVMT